MSPGGGGGGVHPYISQTGKCRPLIELWSKNDDLVSTYTRSENGYGFKTLGLKTGVENNIFWSKIGSVFGKLGGTPPPKIPMNTPHPPGLCQK